MSIRGIKIVEAYDVENVTMYMLVLGLKLFKSYWQDPNKVLMHPYTILTAL